MVGRCELLHLVVGREAGHQMDGNAPVARPGDLADVGELELEKRVPFHGVDGRLDDATEPGRHASGQDHGAHVPFADGLAATAGQHLTGVAAEGGQGLHVPHLRRLHRSPEPVVRGARLAAREPSSQLVEGLLIEAVGLKQLRGLGVDRERFHHRGVLRSGHTQASSTRDVETLHRPC